MFDEANLLISDLRDFSAMDFAFIDGVDVLLHASSVVDLKQDVKGFCTIFA